MKFINLLQKELKELINAEMIASLVLIMAILMFVGNITQNAIDDTIEENNNPKINISDRDDTDFTKSLIETLRSTGAEVKEFDTEGDGYADILKNNDIKNLVILPEGFTETIEKNERPQIITVSRMTSAAAMSNISTGNSGAVELIKKSIADTIAESSGITTEELELIENPITLQDNTVVDDKSAEISVNSIINKVMMQNMILPIIVFLLIMMTSQSLISSISNEKIDKTLETLLSSPVSRTSIITAKMLAAAVVALINAAAFMVGFSKFLKGASADAISGVVSDTMGVDEAIEQLGLSLSVGDYILVGLQLFLTIMICLSVSIMLGALVNDTKSSQTVIMPIMILAMVPYIISMISDINTLPMAIRIIVYAMPFTHTFSGISNLMFGNNTIFICGLIYQIVIFFVCMFFALRLFNSDKILTISLNLGAKSKYNRKKEKTKD